MVEYSTLYKFSATFLVTPVFIKFFIHPYPPLFASYCGIFLKIFLKSNIILMDHNILVPQIMGLPRFKTKYGSFVKDQYLFEQMTDPAKTEPEI